MRSVAATPCAERRLDAWIQPLLGSHPPLQQRQVNTAESRCALDGRQRAEWDACAALVHSQEQGAHGTRMQDMRLLDELDAVNPVKRELSGDQGYVTVIICQPP